jgi:phosphatidylserine decarboxylase
MKISKGGIDILLGSGLIFLIFVLLAVFVKATILTFFTVLFGLFFLFNFYFFRDPERKIPAETNAILSPADGKIVQICEVEEKEFFKAKVKRISIFLSIFNVHVNRIPISGTVEYFNYHRGKFFAAYKKEASYENERTIIGIKSSNNNQILFSQIAGVLARRVMCDIREGYTVKSGERMGLIRYGSRVDVFFPIDKVELKVSTGYIVKGGESILGYYK